MGKLKFRKFLVLTNAFPTREEHLGDARLALVEAIRELKNEGVKISSEFICFEVVLKLTRDKSKGDQQGHGSRGVYPPLILYHL